MVILSSLASISPDESIKYASNWFILAQILQNLKFVNLKCVTTHNPFGPLKICDKKTKKQSNTIAWEFTLLS